MINGRKISTNEYSNAYTHAPDVYDA
jgi:hypothetical protein